MKASFRINCLRKIQKYKLFMRFYKNPKRIKKSFSKWSANSKIKIVGTKCLKKSLNTDSKRKKASLKKYSRNTIKQ